MCLLGLRSVNLANPYACAPNLPMLRVAIKLINRIADI